MTINPKMTTWYVPTCHCIIQYNEPLNEARMVQAVQCKTHDTAQECLAHHRSIPQSPESRRVTEKNKPEFQRR